MVPTPRRAGGLLVPDLCYALPFLPSFLPKPGFLSHSSQFGWKLWTELLRDGKKDVSVIKVLLEDRGESTAS